MKETEGQEFSIDGGKTWTTKGVFKNLKEKKKYTVITRLTETELYQPGRTTKFLEITTKRKEEERKGQSSGKQNKKKNNGKKNDDEKKEPEEKDHPKKQVSGGKKSQWNDLGGKTTGNGSDKKNGTGDGKQPDVQSTVKKTQKAEGAVKAVSAGSGNAETETETEMETETETETEAETETEEIVDNKIRATGGARPPRRMLSIPLLAGAAAAVLAASGICDGNRSDQEAEKNIMRNMEIMLHTPYPGKKAGWGRTVCETLMGMLLFAGIYMSYASLLGVSAYFGQILAVGAGVILTVSVFSDRQKFFPLALIGFSLVFAVVLTAGNRLVSDGLKLVANRVMELCGKSGETIFCKVCRGKRRRKGAFKEACFLVFPGVILAFLCGFAVKYGKRILVCFLVFPVFFLQLLLGETPNLFFALLMVFMVLMVSSAGFMQEMEQRSGRVQLASFAAAGVVF